MASLNQTEVKLISKVHPYINMVILPAGGQHGLKGQSINIPIPIQTICNQLPRTSDDASFVKIFSAKSEHYYEVINVHKIDKGLQWLKVNNKDYNDIDIFSSYINDHTNIILSN